MRRSPFLALRNRNFRLYFIGQSLSASGTWMQRVAQAWLVLDLTGSPVALGTVTALQYLPILALSLTAGVFIDRLPRHRLLVVLQAIALGQAALLAVLTLTGAVQLWHVYALAFLLGCLNAFDSITRNTYAIEMVDREDMQGAVSLNASTFNLARIGGPAAAGVIIAAGGPGWCFLANAVSYLAVLIALSRMSRDQISPAAVAPKASVVAQLKDGLRYARSEREISVPLLLHAFIGTFGLNFAVVLPLFARFALDVGPVAFGALNAAQGAGAVAGSLVVATAGRPTIRRLLWASIAFAALLLVLGVTPTLAIGIPVIAIVGAAQLYYATSVQAALQLAAREEYRGRVMSIYSQLTAGSTPIGSTFTGALTDLWGIRATIAVESALCFVGVAIAWRRANAQITHRLGR